MQRFGSPSSFSGPLAAAAALLPVCGSAQAQQAAPQPPPDPLPVREITVFKDGHAFLVRQGKVRADSRHTLTLPDLPNPVLGTFWPYVDEPGVRFVSATAGRETVRRERDAAAIDEFLAVNVGREIRIERTLNDPSPLTGTLLSLTVPPSGPPDPAPTPYSSLGYVRNPQGVIPLAVVKTPAGIVPVSLNAIYQAVLPADAQTRITDTQERNRLTLELSPNAAEREVEAGLMYLQKGLRWIPNYRVTLDGKGMADVEMQATLVNDLMDFAETTLNLVVGVPTFTFKDTPDPIGLLDTFARLSPYFDSASPTGGQLSNAIMTQSARAGERIARDEAGGVPDSAGFLAGERAEDLFLFTLKNISLKKGQRMTLPVTRFPLPYQDIYTLELLPSLPEAFQERVSDPMLLRLMATPQVQHKARLTNNSKYPLTTAPALLFRGGRILAQGLMTYTARGAHSDLALTRAVEIQVKREDVEQKRTPNAVQINGYAYTQVNLKGTITLTNYQSQPAAIEVVRYVLGRASSASGEGTITPLDPNNEPAEVAEIRSRLGELARHNGLSRIVWKLTLPPGQSTTLTYDWEYVFR